MSFKAFLIVPFLLAVYFHVAYSQDGFAAQNGGTTGGAGGNTVSVCTEAELNAAVADDTARIVKITCNIRLTALVRVGSNKSILGAALNAGISGHGFYIRRKRNVIIRGLRIAYSVAPDDGVGIDETTNVWIDHNEFFSDLNHDKDFYDGLLDMKHAADFITVSWNKFHTHFKANLVGHSDSNESEDRGKLRLTYHHNWFLDCNSRLPSIRFGTAHIYNNVYENVGASGINSRMGAQVLVEGNIFRNTKLPLTTNLDSRDDGYAVERNNDWGGETPVITQPCSFTSPPYSYTVDDLGNMEAVVKRDAGATIRF